METIVLVIHLILALGIVATVLLQKSEGGGLGIGGGGNLMSVRGTANLLTRATAILAGGFMVTSLTLAILAGMKYEPRSILDAPAAQTAPAEEKAPGPPKVPLSQ